MLNAATSAAEININIADRITAPAERAERRAALSPCPRDSADFTPGSLCSPGQSLHTAGGWGRKRESQAHKASELNHNLICLWYKWALTYYLIMGFSAKPPSIAALQSTCLRRSADPTLGPPRDPGSCDLSGLLELMVSQEGRRWEEGGVQQEAVSSLRSRLATSANSPGRTRAYKGPG